MVGDMSVGGVGRSIILLAAVLLTAGNAPADSSMSMDTTAGAPGTTNLVPVNVLIDTNVVSLQFDLLYATNDLTPGTPVGGNALSDQQLFSNVVSPGQFRVLAISFADTPLTNGVAVYVPFAIGAEASDHDEPLVLSNVVLVSAQAEAVPVTVASNATLSITVPPHFTAVVPTGAGATGSLRQAILDRIGQERRALDVARRRQSRDARLLRRARAETVQAADPFPSEDQSVRLMSVLAADKRRVGRLGRQLQGLELALRPVALPVGFGSAPAPTVGAYAVTIAERYLGVRYLWGGNNPDEGFDCSGFVQFVYAQLGIRLPHYAASQYSVAPHVDAAELEPGDLVFFEPRADGPGHVGIYVGGDVFIEAPHTGDVVKLESVSAEANLVGYVGAARPAVATAP